MLPEHAKSLPRPVRGAGGPGPSNEGGSQSLSIPIPGSTPHDHGIHHSTPSTRFNAAEQDHSSLSRSFAAGSFVAGHCVFARQSSFGHPSRGTPGKQSLEGLASHLQHQTSGMHLGLEPGLGLSNHLHEQQKQLPLPFSTDAELAAAIAQPAGSAHADTSAATAQHAAVTVEAGATSINASWASTAAPAAASTMAAAAAAANVKGKQQLRMAALRQNVLYGIINSIVGIPTMISFAAIVYQDPFYKPLLGQLARLSFFSAATHQLVFTLCSSLPFAVGQPQDVGLIFLSAMATSVADTGREIGLSSAEIVGTALLTLTVATAAVGVLTMLVAKFRLATLVQYVPLPVVGGYLGYVGYFCLAAGIGLGCNTNIDSFSSWSHLAHRDALIKFAPTLAAALVLWVCMTRARSPWALPITLAAIPVAFHVYLLVTGATLQQAQDAGWVLKPQGKTTEQFWELYNLFNISDWRLSGVYLPALARQIPKMLGLFFVVTFGSCLDVAAIQADTPYPIDFNNELGTVGLSNVVVGLTGSGYTGSYIFSQTIFSMRAGVDGTAHGAIIAALEATIFLVPFSVVQYLPTFFFGALLTVFGIEIAGDWLIRSYSKVTRAEYLLLLATFIAIMQLELEKGVAAGMLMCTIFFAVTYARANMSAFTVLQARSAAVRSVHESRLLDALGYRLATVALSGYMFFGSSVLVSNKVVQVAEAIMASSAASSTAIRRHLQHAAAHPPGSTSTSKGHARSAFTVPLNNGPATAAASGSSPGHEAGLALLEQQAPAFIILDFRRVLGVDATAAQTLSSLAMVLRRIGAELIFTRVKQPGIRRLLVAHGIISNRDAELCSRSSADGTGASSSSEQEQPLLSSAEQEEEGEAGFCRMFDTLNEGTKYGEDRLLAMAQAAGLLQESITGISLHQFFSMHCSQSPLTSHCNVDQITSEVAKLGIERNVAAGQRLFGFEEEPNSFFLVLKGVLAISVNNLSPIPSGFRPLPARLDVFEVERTFSSGQGAVVGITDFVLQQPRNFQADASTDCIVVEVSRSALEIMAVEVPAVATALQAVLLRDACLSEVYAYEVLERASIT